MPTATLGGMKQHPNTAFDTGSGQAGGAAVPLRSDIPPPMQVLPAPAPFAWPPPQQEGRAGESTDGLIFQSNPWGRSAAAHDETVLHPKDEGHCLGHREQHHFPKTAIIARATWNTQRGCSPCPCAQVCAGGEAVDFNSSAGKLLPILIEI